MQICCLALEQSVDVDLCA